MQAIILAGGKGKRLRPYTSVLPKPLMPIGERPIMDILVRQLKNYGFDELIIAVGYLHHMIESYFGDGRDFGVKIEYSLESKPLGTAGPLALLKERLDQNFLVLNGDLLTTINFKDLYDNHIKSRASASIATFQREVKVDYGVIEADDDNFLEDYIEKPSLKYDVSMGINVLKKKDIETHLKMDQYLDIPNLMELLISNNQRVKCLRQSCLWLDIGRIEDYEIAEDVYKKHIKEFK